MSNAARAVDAALMHDVSCDALSGPVLGTTSEYPPCSCGSRQAVDMYVAERTAVLRAALGRFIRKDGHVVDCPALTQDDADAVCEAQRRCIVVRALLADPEGQRP